MVGNYPYSDTTVYYLFVCVPCVRSRFVGGGGAGVICLRVSGKLTRLKKYGAMIPHSRRVILVCCVGD